MTNERSTRQRSITSFVTAGLALAALGGGTAVAAGDSPAPPGRSIAYVFTTATWAMYETKDMKEECPSGINTMGPREQFKALFPDDGKQRTMLETQIKREAEIWWPDTTPDPYPIPAATGKFAPGINLDGKVDANDFTSPEGNVPGIDNQFFRAVGCVANYRTGGPLYNYDLTYSRSGGQARILIELTDVDSLLNDDDVTLTTYRGLDSLTADASGQGYQAGGSQRLDLRYGKAFIHTGKAKIVNGVLTTQPMDFVWPTTAGIPQLFRETRFQVALTPETAEGVIGGYINVNAFYNGRIRNWGTPFQAYGQQAQASTYKALRKFADAYPDAKTGENTAISGAISVKMVQTYVIRPDQKISELPIRQVAAGK